MNDSKKTFYSITTGEFISNIGDRFQKLAFPILIYNISHSSFALSGMVIIEMLPQLILGFFMGYILDKYNRKRSMCLSIILQMLLCFCIPIIHYYNGPLILYYSIAFLLPALAVFFQTSFSVVLPTLFPKEDLKKFNAQFQSVRTLSKLLSPGIAGILISQVSINWIFILNGFSFLILLILISVSNIPEIEANKENERLGTIIQGFSYNFRNKYLRVALISTIIVNICMLGFNSTIIYYLKSELSLSDQLIGIVYSISGLGSLLGAIFISIFFKNKSLISTLAISMPLIPLFVVVSALFDNWIIFSISYGMLSFMVTISSIVITTLQQQESNEKDLGKILSSSFVISMTLAPLGSVICSLLSSQYNSAVSLIFLGAICGVLVIATFISFIRKET